MSEIPLDERKFDRLVRLCEEHEVSVVHLYDWLSEDSIHPVSQALADAVDECV